QRHGRGAEEVQERVGRERVLDAAADGPAGAEAVVAGVAAEGAVGAARAVGEAAGAVHEGAVEGVAEAAAHGAEEVEAGEAARVGDVVAGGDGAGDEGVVPVAAEV